MKNINIRYANMHVHRLKTLQGLYNVMYRKNCTIFVRHHLTNNVLKLQRNR